MMHNWGKRRGIHYANQGGEKCPHINGDNHSEGWQDQTERNKQKTTSYSELKKKSEIIKRSNGLINEPNVNSLSLQSNESEQQKA